MPSQLARTEKPVFVPVYQPVSHSPVQHAPVQQAPVQHAPAQSLARKVAKAAGTFEHERLGHDPSRVTVVTGRNWMVVCLQSSLAPLERIVARCCEASAAEIERRQRVAMERSLDELRRYIHDRTGVELIGAMVSIDASTGSVLKTFTTTPAVDLFLLGQGLPCLGVPIDAHVRADGPHVPGAAGSHAVGTTQPVRREPFAMTHF